MTSKVIIGASLLLLAIGVSSCKKKRLDTLQGVMTWEVLDVSREYVDPYVLEEWGADNDMPSCRVSIKTIYPECSKSEYIDVRDSLIKVLTQRIYLAPLDDYSQEGVRAHINKYVEEELEDYKLDLEQAKKLNFDVSSYSVFNREFSYTDSIVYSKHGILSVLTTATEYSGGAHSNEVVSTLNYDLNSKQVITESTLFKDINDGQLRELLLKALMNSFGVDRPEDLGYHGIFNYQALEVTRNLYFEDKGITFYYNPYELATYSVGPIKLHLSYQELAPYLKGEYNQLADDE